MKPYLGTTHAAIGMVLGIASVSAGHVTYQTRVLSSEAAPGTGSGVLFWQFAAPVINDQGEVAFGGFLSGVGVNTANDAGIWSGPDGAHLLLAREGDAAPGTEAGTVFRTLGGPVINNAGATGFTGTLSGPSVNNATDEGIWLGAPGSVQIAARNGGQAPGANAGVRYDFFGSADPPALDDNGRISFRLPLTNTATQFAGLFVGAPGTVTAVALIGDQAPGYATGVVFADLTDSFFPVLNADGRTIFRGQVSGSGIDPTNSQGIWTDRSGSLELVVRRGDAAPGAGAGVLFGNLQAPPVLNDAGRLAFTATVTGPGVDPSFDEGIWTDRSGSLAPVVLPGDAVPGESAGTRFVGIGSPVMNGSGQIAFLAAYAPPNTRYGIFLDTDGTLERIAAQDKHAPGTEAGVSFAEFSLPFLNNLGQIAFQAQVLGDGISTANDVGIWMTDCSGVLQLIAREGDLFDVNDDPLIEDLRTISQVTLSLRSGEHAGGEDGRATPINDLGQFAFRLRFADGSEGIFVADVCSMFVSGVPEPTTLPLLALGGFTMLRRRSRRIRT